MASGFPDYVAFEVPVTVPSGGTGASSWTLNGVLIGNGANALKVTAAGAANHPLRVPAAGGEPAFGTLDLSQCVANPASGALLFQAGGSNQNVTLTPSGTGFTILGGSVGIGTSTPKTFSGVTFTNSLWLQVQTSSGNVAELGLDGGQARLWLRASAAVFNNKNALLKNANGTLSIIPADDDTTERTAALSVALATGAVTIGTLALTNPLPVASGGSGTATPALVAGIGISISGSWPNHTVAIATLDGARVYNSANEAITTATFTALTFDSERYDNGGLHSTVSNTSRLTAQKAGAYSLWGNVYFDANATGLRQVRIKLNAVTWIAVESGLPQTDGTALLTVSTLHRLSVGDYVELVVYQSSGGNLNVVASGDFSPEFAMQWLGP